MCLRRGEEGVCIGGICGCLGVYSSVVTGSCWIAAVKVVKQSVMMTGVSGLTAVVDTECCVAGKEKGERGCCSERVCVCVCVFERRDRETECASAKYEQEQVYVWMEAQGMVRAR